jgi:hypothetical protein
MYIIANTFNLFLLEFPLHGIFGLDHYQWTWNASLIDLVVDWKVEVEGVGVVEVVLSVLLDPLQEQALNF